MSMFTIFVLCAAAVSIHSVYAAEDENDSSEGLEAVAEDCAKQYGHTLSEVIDALNKRDLSNIEPCFWGCAFTKAGFIDSHGKYDLKSGLIQIRKWILDRGAYADVERVAKQCESVNDKAVSDGEAGCERGKLATACFLDEIERERQLRYAAE